jgi:hypothetical protein
MMWFLLRFSVLVVPPIFPVDPTGYAELVFIAGERPHTSLRTNSETTEAVWCGSRWKMRCGPGMIATVVCGFICRISSRDD